MKISDIVFFLFFSLFIYAIFSYPPRSSDEDTSSSANLALADSQIYLMKDTSVNIYWKEKIGSEKKVLVNEEYIDTMSDPEKAALGYISLFTLCQNASKESLDFLKKWFRYDKQSLSKLNDHASYCIKNTEFEEIKMKVTADTIKISFTINETYPFEKKIFQEDTFQLYENYLVMVEETKTAVN